MIAALRNANRVRQELASRRAAGVAAIRRRFQRAIDEGDSARERRCVGARPFRRDSHEAKGVNIGLTISIPNDEFDNPYGGRELHINFLYFFMRKFWFVYLAKVVVLFPGVSVRSTSSSRCSRERFSDKD
jgi:hypothetical protein